VTNTEHPRDILLFLDGTWTYREQCGPELLRDGNRPFMRNLIARLPEMPIIRRMQT